MRIKVIIRDCEVERIENIPKGTAVEVHYVSDLPDSPIVESYEEKE